MRPTVLVIDDEKTFRMVVEEALTAEGLEVIPKLTGEAGFRQWEREPAELVLLGRRLPDMDGLSLLAKMIAKSKREKIDSLLMMATEPDDIESPVRALKLGAFDYLVKPVRLPELIVAVRRALEMLRLRRKIQRIDKQDPGLDEAWIAAPSAKGRGVLRQIEQVAQAPDTTVLIQGESGTGKDLVAKIIRRLTPGRCEQPFVTIHCGSMNEASLEDELFGHERGAFTNAKTQKRGLLEVADGGTLFFDEIGAMPIGAQAKLLRVVESRAFRRIGGTRDLTVSVRVIASTRKSLAKEVECGGFREDLLHRLDVFPIELPPLRGRVTDISTLADHFLQLFADRMNRPDLSLTDSAKETLYGYDYPGNVRELRNIIERAIILSPEPDIGPGSMLLRGDTAESFFHVDLDRSGMPQRYEDVGNAYIDRVLRFAAGNRSMAARLLGLSYPTVMKKLGEHAAGRDGRR
jgi:two-component system response regulator AtoC